MSWRLRRPYRFPNDHRIPPARTCSSKAVTTTSLLFSRGSVALPHPRREETCKQKAETKDQNLGVLVYTRLKSYMYSEIRYEEYNKHSTETRDKSAHVHERQLGLRRTKRWRCRHEPPTRRAGASGCQPLTSQLQRRVRRSGDGARTRGSIRFLMRPPNARALLVPLSA